MAKLFYGKQITGIEKGREHSQQIAFEVTELEVFANQHEHPGDAENQSVTNNGARLESSVELVTDVSLSDQCQSVRSAANKNPHAMIISHGLEATGFRAAQSTGSAMATRQKAVAVGPVWLRRTQMGAKAIPTAPSSAAAKAELYERVCTQLEGTFTPRFCSNTLYICAVSPNVPATMLVPTMS